MLLHIILCNPEMDITITSPETDRLYSKEFKTAPFIKSGSRLGSSLNPLIVSLNTGRNTNRKKMK